MRNVEVALNAMSIFEQIVSAKAELLSAEDVAVGCEREAIENKYQRGSREKLITAEARVKSLESNITSLESALADQPTDYGTW